MLQQFIRGLGAKCRTHTVATGPETFEEACKTAMLFESAKSLDKDEPPKVTPLVHDVRSPLPPNRQSAHNKPPLNPPSCSYCKRVGHSIQECRTRAYNNSRRQSQGNYSRPSYQRSQSQGPSRPTQQQQEPQGQQHGISGRAQPNYSTATDSRCFKCNRLGHFARECTVTNQTPRTGYAAQSWDENDPIPRVTFQRRGQNQGRNGRQQNLN